MKFLGVMLFTVFSASLWMAAVTLDSPRGVAIKVQPKPLSELIQELADEKFSVRESATAAIWQMGEAALESLQSIALGDDPEQAYRARELIRKIQLNITPSTDPFVIALIERYAKASDNEKVNLFSELHKRRAWRQLLKLYAAEADPKIQNLLMGSGKLEGVAVIAARERLIVGDSKGAREFLEMATADAPGLMALADFHRSQGTLDAEIKRAKALGGVQGASWQLALYRASGNLTEARDAANAAGDSALSVAMSTLLGDPLPWLRKCDAISDGDVNYKPYTQVALKRWEGKNIEPADLEPLMRSVSSNERNERQSAMNALFLLGYPELAEQAYVTSSRLSAFAYFDTLERIPQALETLGIDPVNPDYPAWVSKQFKHLSEAGFDDDPNDSLCGQQLVLLGNFLERHGLNDECSSAFLEPLHALAENDPKVFTEFLSQLFGGNSPSSGESYGAPQVAKQAAAAWAGDRADRWDEVVSCAFGGEDWVASLWSWLAEIEPKATPIERFDGMLALCGMGRDPRGLRNKWLNRAWQAIEQAPQGNRDGLLEKIAFILDQNPDVTNNLKLWDQLPEDVRNQNSWRGHLLDISAVGRWEESVDFFRKQIREIFEKNGSHEPSLYACLAASLRNAGHAEAAADQDALVEKLALGNDALEIANAYAFGSDYKRAAEWRSRAARQSDPSSVGFFLALQMNTETLIRQEKWVEAAAASEVVAQVSASVESGSVLPIAALRLRLQSDLGRALANLKKDRAKSIALLRRCHGIFPIDGSLADDFFPSIRKMGLVQEHDEWFKISWEQICEILKRYPDCDNTCNTAAWLASRAVRNLDQARNYEQHALTLNPEQPAYMDTMAEIEFARGNREKAIEWSTKAVNFLPSDSQLRLQHARFRSSPLPR